MELAEAVLADGRVLRLIRPEPGQAELLAQVIREAFASRPSVQPPPPALTQTAAEVAATLTTDSGILAMVDTEPAGVVLISLTDGVGGIHRVSVRPHFQRQGIASAMMEVALEELAMLGATSVELTARAEFPQVVEWWQRHGFTERSREGTALTLARRLPICRAAVSAEQTQALGRRLAGIVQAGDVLIASGELGAGKTTFTQGLGEGMNVGGAIISPTFVISRIHPARADGPNLVHVDAYRLGSAAELFDLDLEDTLDNSVTLIEWGTGIAEELSDSHLEIDIRRGLGDDETRWIFLTPIGPRWEAARADLEAL